jgi:hypothetical protein
MTLRRPIPILASLGFVLLLGRASAAPLAPDEEWLGMYLLGHKVGYTHTKVTPGAGKGASMKVESESVVRMAILGTALEQRVNMTEEATPAGKPLTSEMTMSSAGHDTRVRARFESNAIHCSVVSGGTTSAKVVPIPAGVSLELDPDLMSRKPLPLNKPKVIHYFNPASLNIARATVEALRTEPLTQGGITYTATVVLTQAPEGDTTAWQDKDGKTLKLKSLLGLTMVRETKEEALNLPSDKYEPPADLGKALAVDAGRALDDPRKASRLKLRLTSPALPAPVADDRQKVERVDPNTVDLTITAPILKPGGSLTLAEAAKREPDAAKPGPYLQSDDPKMKALAKQILDGETNSFWAAQKIRDWVHANMSVKGDIGIVRSGLDVLKDRRGVCRDFAVLYVTLARAAGLPSRIATGLVYSEGAFYYHAWAESYVGRWIDLDPTLPTAFVDATHLKLGHGPAESMLSVGKVMGNLTVKVLDYTTGEGA